jgi:O-antigen/teichoic acid export membrane protein
LFVYRSGVYLYAVCNTFALGFFGPDAALAAYALAERLAKAACSLIDPLSQAIFPRLVRAPGGDLGRTGLALLAGLGTLAGMLLWLAAPWLVRLASGRAWPDAVDALRVFALFPPGAALCQALAVHRFIPAGRDWGLSVVVLGAAAVHGFVLWWLLRLGVEREAHLWLAATAAGLQFLQIAAFRLLGR